MNDDKIVVAGREDADVHPTRSRTFERSGDELVRRGWVTRNPQDPTDFIALREFDVQMTQVNGSVIFTAELTG